MISREDAEKKYKNSDPNKKNVFINWDALEALPEEYEPVFSELTFDPKKLDEYFTNVGTNDKPSWYPQTDVMYKIAEMCGIQGCENKISEWILNEVNINPILMKQFDDEPTMRKIITSARVTKQSKVLCEDGMFRACAPESNEFDFFTRACLDFVKDEEYNNGKPNKYNSSIKRQKRLLELKKFAMQQAETKAFCKTIRVLAGLPTGFDTEDLKEGKLIFMKFIKSKRLQKLETAARLQAISQGRTGEIQNTSNLLFGENQIEPPAGDDNTESENRTEKQNPFKDMQTDQTPPPPPVDEKTQIKNVIEDYLQQNEDKNHENYKKISNVSNATDYLNSMLNSWDSVTIEKAKEALFNIENHITGIKKINHGIDLGKDVF